MAFFPLSCVRSFTIDSIKIFCPFHGSSAVLVVILVFSLVNRSVGGSIGSSAFLLVVLEFSLVNRSVGESKYLLTPRLNRLNWTTVFKGIGILLFALVIGILLFALVLTVRVRVDVVPLPWTCCSSAT